MLKCLQFYAKETLHMHPKSCECAKYLQFIFSEVVEFCLCSINAAVYIHWLSKIGFQVYEGMAEMFVNLGKNKIIWIKKTG